MTTYNWLGGKGSYVAARHWDPQGVPGRSDTAAITQGEVVVRRQNVQAVVSIGGTDASSPPVLDVRNSSIIGVATDGDPYVPYTAGPDGAGPDAPQPAPEYGTINVWGDSRIGSLEVGSLFEGPAETTVNLVGHGTLTTGFSVGNGSNLDVNGDDSSSLNLVNPFSSIRGGHVVINAPVAGQGTIYMDGPYVPGLRLPLPTGFVPHDAFLELGSSVASDVTVSLQVGDLLIDRPQAFLGQIDLAASPTGNLPGFLFSPPPAGPQSVTLEGIAATSYGFDDGSHTLTLFNGADAVDQLRFTQDVTAASFTPDGSAGPGSNIAVSQTAGGVFVSHLPASTPDGATLLPMQG